MRFAAPFLGFQGFQCADVALTAVGPEIRGAAPFSADQRPETSRLCAGIGQPENAQIGRHTETHPDRSIANNDQLLSFILTPEFCILI